MNPFINFILKAFMLMSPSLIFAQDSGGSASDENIYHVITQLMMQIAVTLIGAWIGGKISAKIRIPEVVGQIIVGVLLSPSLLGGMPIPFIFENGIFPKMEGKMISTELHSIMGMSSVILLFHAGLETNLKLFLRSAFKGLLVGSGGVIIPLIMIDIASSFFTKQPLFHPVNLMMGVVGVATSVGITAQILSKEKKIDSIEGLIILSAAVIDDVLGIIVLSIVLGISQVLLSGATFSLELFKSIGFISLRVVLIWLLCTILGIVFAKRIAHFLKVVFKNKEEITIMALLLAFILGAIFEKGGISMIIGAYIVGLSLSNTDLAYVIKEKLKPIYAFFVPMFFVGSGIMIDSSIFLNKHVVLMGVVMSFVGLLAKFLGAGATSLFFGLNLLGASRVGAGMIPRGEVALIVAGMGMASGILNKELFGVAIVLTLSSDLFSPILFSALIKIKKPGSKKEVDHNEEKIRTEIDVINEGYRDMIVSKFLTELENVDFYVNKMEQEEVYNIRKDEIFTSLYIEENSKVALYCDPKDLEFFKTALIESLAELIKNTSLLKDRIDTSKISMQFQSIKEPEDKLAELQKYLRKDLINMDLKSKYKHDLIREMIDFFAQRTGTSKEKADILYEEIIERERGMSTGMQNGIALPHTKTDVVDKIELIFGIKKDGIDFESLDGKPSNIFIMLLTPKVLYTDHIRVLSLISSKLGHKETREAILSAKNEEEIFNIFS